MPAPVIERVSPTSGWPGGTAADGSAVDGTLVIIHGRYFHPTAEMDRNHVTFTASAGGTVPAPVLWASINEIDYQPAGVVATEATVPGGLENPCGVAVNSSTGDLYIADTSHDRIVRRTAAGVFTSWGETGTAHGQFNRPTGIAVDHNGDVYVADTMNHRIQKFTASGVFITAWGSFGSAVGEFDMPVDVDVGLVGGVAFVYVADSNNHRVARSDPMGGMATQLLVPADAGRILGVCAPRGYGFVYATDPANRRIYRWAWNGPLTGYFGDPGPFNLAVVEVGFPMGIEQDFDGYVYVTDNAGRVVRKFDPFDPSFREIARFGLAPATVPRPTLPEEFVDPVDVAVTDLKSVYVVDRNRKQVVRYTPTDSQELWVHVPEGAATGSVRVRTDEGEDAAGFVVFRRAQLEVAAAYLTQGLSQYPLVAGKRTVIRYQMRTVGETSPESYSWGSPVHDSAVCRVFRDGAEVGQVEGEVEYLTMSGGFLSFEIAFEIRFSIPYWIINEEATYRFHVMLQRIGTPAFNDSRDFPDTEGATFRNRNSYRIVASPISHMRHDGSRVSEGEMFPALFYLGSDVGHMIDWMDWAQLYSGYVHYNRIYPLRYSVADITDWGIWVNHSMHNGIDNDDEVRDILSVLEYTRRDINEEGGADYDFMLGIVDRNEVTGSQTWAGVTSDAYHSALISVGLNFAGNPAYDIGAIIAHELLHQHGIHEQSERELAQSDEEAWNSVSGNFIRDPVTLMYNPPTGFRQFDWNDETAFAEGRHDGVDGEYDVLFDALANPHPKRMRVRERALKAEERPHATPRNFTLIGYYTAAAGFTRTASWIGRSGTAVTPEVDDSRGILRFIDADGKELLRWHLHISFGLRTISRTGRAAAIGEGSATVSVTCPFPDATAQVALVIDKEEVWRTDVPTAGPIVHLLTPRGGEHVSSADLVVVEWEASHPQELALDYRLSYSSDGGKIFRPLAVGVRNTRYEWQLGLGASSGRIRLRIAASDGFNQAKDVSDDILVGDVARRIAIIQPRRGEVIPEGRTVRLAAVANDLEQGAITLTAGNTRWLLDGEVLLGNGNDIDIRDIVLTTPRGDVTTPLPVGAHLLSVELMLGPGKTLRDEIPIEIAADSDRDGIPDDVEIAQGMDPADPGNGGATAPVYLFGQWRFRYRDSHTLFQISHLLAGRAIIELGFLDEQGSALSSHPLELMRDNTRALLTTDSEGRARVELGSLQTILLKVAGIEGRRKGFGTSWVRVAKDSPLTETALQAHAWISRERRCWWIKSESQGTVVINAGKPLKIRGAKVWKGSSPKMIQPLLNHRLLGRLKMAASRVSKNGTGSNI